LSAKSSGMRWGGVVVFPTYTSKEFVMKSCVYNYEVKFWPGTCYPSMFSLPIFYHLYFLPTQIQLVCPVIWLPSERVCWLLMPRGHGLPILLIYSLTESLIFSLDWPGLSWVQLPGWALYL
jgi:hypothetical protein